MHREEEGTKVVNMPESYGAGQRVWLSTCIAACSPFMRTDA